MTIVKQEVIITGKNSVFETIVAGKRRIYALYILQDEKPYYRELLSLIKKQSPRTKIIRVDADEMVGLVGETVAHQGVAILAEAPKAVEIDDVLDQVQKEGRDPFLLVAAGITDPHNLGAILRSSAAVGVDAVIIPKQRSASLNPTVSKVAAGAVEHVPVIEVTNINNTLNALKDRGLWIYGAQSSGKEIYDVDLRGPMVLVIGSEGKGLPRLTAETCDVLISIPMSGKVESLNASVAAGVVLYEIYRQRRGN